MQYVVYETRNIAGKAINSNHSDKGEAGRLAFQQLLISSMQQTEI